jgi:hypothetical protein
MTKIMAACALAAVAVLIWLVWRAEFIVKMLEHTQICMVNGERASLWFKTQHEMHQYDERKRKETAKV